jgi:hypothetical protein
MPSATNDVSMDASFVVEVQFFDCGFTRKSFLFVTAAGVTVLSEVGAEPPHHGVGRQGV